MQRSNDISKTLLIAMCAVLLLACKKNSKHSKDSDTFNHEVTVPQDCPDCAIADSYEGTYKGVRIVYPQNHEPVVADSIVIVADHIFKNQGAFIDSVKMFMRLKVKPYGSPDTVIVVCEVKNGFAHLPQGTGYTNFYFGGNKLKMEWFGDHYDQIRSWTYTGYRVP